MLGMLFQIVINCIVDISEINATFRYGFAGPYLQNEKPG